MKEARIIKVAGPLVVAEGCLGAKMYDMVRVSQDRLIGEIIELKRDLASIQVYEETAGIGPNDPVYLTGEPLSCELGPGLIGSVYDGIQRPLDILRLKYGDFVVKGINLPALDRQKTWYFKPKVSRNELVEEGDILGEVEETALVTHRVLVPLGIKGRVLEIYEGEFKIDDTVAKIESEGKVLEINMSRKWPVRKGRPVKERLSPNEPLVTGQRVIDTLFPIAKGGSGCIPGPFGSGKTVFLHEVAKWSNADIIVYCACGERGNEVADLLLTLPELKDPSTGRPLLERTVVIANTSNMPVAAREASVYTAITIAEYFRDMGYAVALMADSTSRWAEALREISGRLQEMPGEEGYPAYLSTRIAQFYERAGKVVCLGKEKRLGSLTVMGAVSPPGGDLSCPVVQATLRVVKVFWSLDDRLASARHFPAINWLLSYSLYHQNLKEFIKKHISEEFLSLKKELMRILEEEAELLEIARLVGIESLSLQERLLLETAKSIREDFLHQNAFHPIDTYSSLRKQYLMLKSLLMLHKVASQLLDKGFSLKEVLELPIREKIFRLKYIPEDRLEEFKDLEEELEKLL
ncbi:MAG: V-type ATP synthase subunit A [Candidatus Omnitrophica bacterium]|nr:V-type ATP synthase subunit A [Candidatus Omnitrophota bacterium]